jgi:hypothetical protein
MFCRPCFNRCWGLKYIPRLFSEYMLTFRVEEPMKIRVLDRKPDRVTGYKVLIDLTSLIYIYIYIYYEFSLLHIFSLVLQPCTAMEHRSVLNR